MELTEENSVQEEVAPPEVEPEAPQEQHEQEPVEDRQEKNWRAVRQRISELEKQNQEKDELIKKALEFQRSQHQQVQPEEPEPDSEEYVNYGGLKKVASKTVEPLKKEIEELRGELSQRRQRELFENLRRQYPDFDEVVNQETIALFEEKEPELAKTIGEVKDPYKMGIQTYKYIKALNMASEVPSRRRQNEAQKKLEKNEKTIQSPQAYDKRPMAQAFKMTEAEKSKLYEEMMGYASMAPTSPPI